MSSVTLAHPFRLDAAGSAAVITQGVPRHALEIVRHIVSCRVGERPLAPEWGIADPLADGVDESDVRAAIDLCEPDIAVSGVTLRPSGAGDLDIIIDAAWRA
jgi:hypothetical protein